MKPGTLVPPSYTDPLEPRSGWLGLLLLCPPGTARPPLSDMKRSTVLL